MNNLTNKKLRGYHRHFRGRFLLLRDKLLTDEEFILWDLGYSVLADWDRNHTETYGGFELTFDKIGSFLGWSSSKANRKAQKLFSLGLWTRKAKRIFIGGFEIREHLPEITRERKIVDLQQFLTKLQPQIAKPQQSVSKLQHNLPKENDIVPAQTIAKLQRQSPKPLVSYKGEFNGYRSDEEYLKMWKGNPDGLSIEDMKWIDKNIKEYPQL